MFGGPVLSVESWASGRNGKNIGFDGFESLGGA